MHFNVAQRVANRLDTEIRVLSGKLPEQMTAGSEQGPSRNSPAAQLSVVLPTLEDNSPTMGKCSGTVSERYSLFPQWDLISLCQSCSHPVDAKLPVSARRKAELCNRSNGS